MLVDMSARRGQSGILLLNQRITDSDPNRKFERACAKARDPLPCNRRYQPLPRCATVSCRYSLEELLAVVHDYAPAKVDALTRHRRHVDYGCLSVGLKIHCLGDGRLSTLVQCLGGAPKILDINYYKHRSASFCLVLPPVGGARSAILLLECIGSFLGYNLFSNRDIQIQVCSPGRLDARRSALLAVGFYLGSDTLRRYILNDLATSFAKNRQYPRGKRLVLYDAEGDFDRNFDWWSGSGSYRVIQRQLPFYNGRSDVLIGNGSRLDIENINLLATLLVHAQYQGYWRQLGIEFQEEMEALLERHILSGLLDAPWVRTEAPETADDATFYAALQDLWHMLLKRQFALESQAVTSVAGGTCRPGRPAGSCKRCSPCFAGTV